MPYLSYYNSRYLEWVNSFALDDQGNLTLLVNKLSRFIYAKLNINEPNFRLIASNVGGKNYLYDRNYNYMASSETPNVSTTTTTTTTTTEKPEVPELKPGTDQDPYLAPNPEPEPEPTAEPKPEPEPTSVPSSSTSASSTPSTTSTTETSTTSSEPPASSKSISEPQVKEVKSSSNRLAVGFLAFTTAGMLFVF